MLTPNPRGTPTKADDIWPPGQKQGAEKLLAAAEDLVFAAAEDADVNVAELVSTVEQAAPDGWPEPSLLGDELRPVPQFDTAMLPASLRPLVEDVSDRMQTPPDFAATAAIVTLAGAVNRRASIRPKVLDHAWVVTPNLWGAVVAHPGWLKTPVQDAITRLLRHIEGVWHAEFEREMSAYEAEKEIAEISRQTWREQYKVSLKKGAAPPLAPDSSLAAPTQKRLVLTDSTFEKLHEILSENPAGVMVVRDELTGWLSDLEKPGRESERAFFLQAWNGDGGFTVDRIGRGSIHVPAVCVSLLGNIQPTRLRAYLSDAVAGGPGDDGLFQRFQILVWPDTVGDWKLVDRAPNNLALTTMEDVLSTLVNIPHDDPIKMCFAPDAQELFFSWWTELEHQVRGGSGIPMAMVSHLAKYRSLMPSLALLFELADVAAKKSDFGNTVSLEHAQMAAELCVFLEAHAYRAYGAITSPETRMARDLARHIQRGDLPAAFKTRAVYLKGWSGLSTPEDVRAALSILESAGWVRPAEMTPTGGRPSESWLVNPGVYRAK